MPRASTDAADRRRPTCVARSPPASWPSAPNPSASPGAVTGADPALTQLAYEIQAAPDAGVRAATRRHGRRRRRPPGRRRRRPAPPSQPGGALPPGPRSGPSRAGPTGAGRCGSRPACSTPDDWVAQRGDAARRPGRDAAVAARRSCGASSTLPAGVVAARLYVTSLGVHEVTINGRRVADELLAPGWTRTGGGCSPTPTTSRTCSRRATNVDRRRPRRRLVSRAPGLGPGRRPMHGTGARWR